MSSDKRQASRGNKETFHSIANSIPLLNLLETLLRNFLSAHSTAASATTSTTSAATTWCTAHWFATSASTVTGTSTATSFWTIINEKSIQWNRVWKDVVTDIISTNRQSVQLLWFTALWILFMNHHIDVIVKITLTVSLTFFKWVFMQISTPAMVPTT